MMNIFRISADMIHLVSILILLLKLNAVKNCHGISLKTQFIYCIVFSCRYLDLFWNFYSIYNWVMKFFFICSSYFIVYQMKYQNPIRKTYDIKLDTFNILFVLVPCVVLALIWNINYSPFEILWAFSIYIESVAILPQIIMVRELAKEFQEITVQNITSHYMFCLGTYRALYVANWVYRYATEQSYWDPISWFGGIIQTILYSDFLYYYVKARVKGDAIVKFGTK